MIGLTSGSFAAENSQSVLLTSEEKTWIAEHPLVTVTNASDWAPLDFSKNGEAMGFSIDYLNLAADKVGLKLKYINGHSWGTLLSMLERREIDISHGILKTNSRSKFLNFTKPYLDLPRVYYGRTGSPKINGIQDLEGKTIAVVKGSLPWEVYRNRYNHLKLVEYERSIEALKDLSRGVVDVYSGVLPIANYTIDTNLISGVEIIGPHFYPDEGNEEKIRFASRNDWPLLNSILEKGMDSISEAELREISLKWNTNTKKQNVGLTTEEEEWLRENNVIKVAIEPNGRPFDFVDNESHIEGISGEILEKIGSILNVEFVWSGNKTWAEGLDQLQNGKSDVVAAIQHTSERESFLEFTDSYYSASELIFANPSRLGLSGLEKLKGKKVALVKGDAKVDYLRMEYPTIDILELSSIKEALLKVSSGDADAYIGGIASVNNQIMDLKLTDIVVVGDTNLKTDLSVGIRSNLPLLASSIKKAMSFISEQEKNRIVQKWIVMPAAQNEDYSIYVELSALLIFLMAIILLWNKKLRDEILLKNRHEKMLFQEKTEEEIRKSELEYRLNWFHSAFENVTTGAIIADMKGDIKVFNAAAEKIFGYTPEEVIGKNVKVLMPEFHAQRHDGYLKNHIETGEKKIIGIGRKVSAVRKNGEEFPIHLGVGRMTINNKTSFIGSITDLTEITQTQYALEKALDEATKSSKAKSKFLAETSHELRTPLNAIIGFSEMLQNKYFGELNKKQSDYVNDIYRSGCHLLDLINTLLDLTEVESGNKEINKEILPVTRITEECTSILKPQLIKKEISLNVSVAPEQLEVYADHLALKQVLINILTNAVKYTGQGDEINISVRNDGNYLKFEIADTGQGIEPELLKHITEPFFKGNKSAYHAEEGWGLGLAITKLLVEAHGGKLNIESKLGVGTKVIIQLPNFMENACPTNDKACDHNVLKLKAI